MAQRPKAGTALVYLRRSTSRQEASLASQMRWAIGAASASGVRINVTESDLETLIASRKQEHGDLYLDDGITGSDLSRPGLTALRQQAVGDKSVSHIFVHMPDRLARPEEASDGVTLESQLRRAGITLVFCNRVATPRRRGEEDLGDIIQSYVSYHESGEYLRKLAQRVIERHVMLAEKSFRTGGRAPYGFERVLVDASGKVVQVLRDKMHVRLDGCHVRLRVQDPEKISVWLMILDWYDAQGIGAKQIANRLNQLGIPSPDAGRTRTDSGVRHRVSGKWGHGTVLSLIKNRAIVGINTYGLQSEGTHRRLGDGVPRVLDDDVDRRADGTAKVINNPPERVIARPGAHKPQADVETFDRCQARLAERGKCQRGVGRTKDPARYPLTLRVIDMSKSEGLPGGCGHPMYAKTSGKRALYVCGRYNKTAGAQCDHNAIDAEAALQHVLNLLQQCVDSAGGRKALEQQLRVLAESVAVPTAGERIAQKRQRLLDRIANVEAEVKIISRNFARAKDDEEMAVLREERAAAKSKLQSLSDQLKQLDASAGNGDHPGADIQRLLEIYDRIEVILKDPGARSHIPRLLDTLNLRLWLDFTEGSKGKRPVRELKGGLITTGGGYAPHGPVRARCRPRCRSGGVQRRRRVAAARL